ncbi:MAG TPA: hypothetical protein VG276_19575, partial [Actinomycetes bacterium]|nr:hypothetical protein [Actinomycetes bacterium]
GHVKFWLEGEKLRGGFALTRVGGGKKPWWLLVKMNDEGADPRRDPVITQPRSVVSGKTIQELAAQRERPPERPSPGGARGGAGAAGG